MKHEIIETTEKFNIPFLPKGTRCFSYKQYTIVLGEEEHSENGIYRHLSISNRKYLPFWDDIKFVRNYFFSQAANVIMYLPGTDNYVNINPTCFQMSERLDQEIKLPEYMVEPDTTKHGICPLGEYSHKPEFI